MFLIFNYLQKCRTNNTQFLLQVDYTNDYTRDSKKYIYYSKQIFEQ